MTPRVQRPKNLEPQCPRGVKDRCPKSRRERVCPFFTFLFHSGAKSIGWYLAHSGGQASLLRLLNWMLILSRNTLIDTLQNHDYQLSGHPLAELSWYKNLTIKMTEIHKLWISVRSFFCLWHSQSAPVSPTQVHFDIIASLLSHSSEIALVTSPILNFPLYKQFRGEFMPSYTL